jgi:hypothetical protein
MSDIVDILDSTTNNGNNTHLLFFSIKEKQMISFSFSIDSINLNVDDDSDESGETPFQRLIRLHTSNSNYNERFNLQFYSIKISFGFSFRKNAVKYILDALRFVNEVESLYEILSCVKKLADDIG